MATSDHIANALLTEHFRYTPLTLLDDIINTVNELVFQAINAIEEGLSSTSARTLGFKNTNTETTTSSEQNPQAEEQNPEAQLEETKQTEIETGIVQLETLLNATVDRDFDKFELYTLRNILSVGHEGEDLASWVRLSHYRGLKLDGTGDGDSGREGGMEEVHGLRRKLDESCKLNALLKAEEVRNERVLARLRGLGGEGEGAVFGFLAGGGGDGGVGAEELVGRVREAVKRVPEVREGLEELKMSLRTLPGAGAEGVVSAEETTRRRYLENQSRKILQRRGLEAGGPEEGGVGKGRRVGRDEVEGLEAVVKALEGAGDGFNGQ